MTHEQCAAEAITPSDIGLRGRFMTRADAMRSIPIGGRRIFAVTSKRHYAVLRGSAYQTIGRGGLVRFVTLRPGFVRVSRPG